MNTQNKATEALISSFADDEDMLELVEMFVEELPSRAKSIESALNEQDLATLKSLAHQLKGAAGGYGFPAITEMARDLEETCEMQGDLEKLKAQTQQIIAMCHSARAR